MLTKILGIKNKIIRYIRNENEETSNIYPWRKQTIEQRSYKVYYKYWVLQIIVINSISVNKDIHRLIWQIFLTYQTHISTMQRYRYICTSHINPKI